MSPFLVHPAQPNTYPQAGELVARSFAHGDVRRYERSLHHWLTARPNAPDFRYTLHRLGILDGEVVAHVRIVPRVLEYGSARLSVGGVSAVCTHPDYRDQGYAGQVLQDAIIFMAEHGAHLALLNGIGSYYDRFGFSPVWPYYHIEVDSAEAAALDSPLRLREARSDDVAEMIALYERHWAGRVTVNRDLAVWAWRVQNEFPAPAQVVIDPKRNIICGYIVGHSLADERVEVVADTPEAARTLLAAGGAACQSAGIPALRWLVPPDAALVSFARQFLTVTVSANYRPTGGWMARLIDARGMVDQLLPEITAQACATDPAFDADALMVDPGGQGVRIGLRTNPASLCQLNYYDFIQVVFGSLRPAALAVRPYSQIQPDGLRLLETLFPPRMAVLGWWDWF
jgi:predicted N-acetyltransferase YhbS